jgi:hypothetical protein
VSQSARIQAVSVGHALDVDSTALGSVHSVYAHAVNLAICGDMWTLLADNAADLPLGIRVTRTSFDKFGLRRGDCVNVRSGFVGVSSRLVVDCRAAPRWTPARAHKSEPGLASRLAIVGKEARPRSWPESAGMARAVRSAVSDANALREVLTKVVGRGPGATPSGDDVLVGILAVLTCPRSGAAGAKAAESLCRALLPLLTNTTEVSGHLLRQAANGLFGRDMHELVCGLIGALSPQCLSETVRRVVNTGATSGADACEGLLAFAPTYFATDERASS